jgi:hypothetical protein
MESTDGLPAGESSHGDTASEQWMVMGPSHSDTASEQWMAMGPSHSDRVNEQWMVMEPSHGDTVSDQQIAILVLTNDTACAYSNERVFNDRVKMNR